MYSANDTLELLFSCKLEGQADVDRLAESVRGVSGATAAASQNLSGLEVSIRELTGAVVAQTEALSGMEGGLGRVTAGTTQLAGGARAATAELRALEGAFPLRAAGAFLSQIQGFAPIISAMFPIVGAIALVGILDQVVEKVHKWVDAHDPLKKAQNESLSILQRTGDEYDKLRDKIKALQMDEYERTHGRDARLRLEATESSTTAHGVDEHNIQRLENYARVLREVTSFHTAHSLAPSSGDPTMGFASQSLVGGDRLSEHQASTLKAAGMEDQLNGGSAPNPFDNVKAGQSLNQRQIDAAQALLLKGIQPEIETAREKQKLDVVTGNDKGARADQDRAKQQAEEAKKRASELAAITKQAHEYLMQAQEYELTGARRINAEYNKRIDLINQAAAKLGHLGGSEQTQVQGAVREAGEARAVEINQWLVKLLKDNRQAMGVVAGEGDSERLRLNGEDSKAYEKSLREQGKQIAEDIASGLNVLGRSDAGDADAVRRRLGSTLRGNTDAVKGGQMTGGFAAGSDYDARVAAANEIFGIETRELSLIDDKDKKEERLAAARKRYEDEIYRAQEQYQNQISDLRERDLEKYQAMAGGIFDALKSHSFNQYARSFATGQEKQVFQNLASPVLQNIGHTVGGLIPGGLNVPGIGNVLQGTVFDNANADPSKQTATNTKETVDLLTKIRADIARIFTGSSNPDVTAPGSGGGGFSSTIGALGGLPLSHSALDNLALYGSDTNGFTGQGSGLIQNTPLFNAGGGSGATQFLSGLGGAGSNPLAAIFTGQSTNGSTVTQLTGIQQAGAAVGTAAMLAGAGLAIASGISQGGVGGFTKAASAGLGAAAALDPEPISKMILGSVAAVTGIVGALLGVGPQQRQQTISNDLTKNQYLAPTALNVMQGENGTYEDFDARGNLRTSNLSALPTVLEPYITKRTINGQQNWYDVPGETTSPYSGRATGTGQAPVSNAGGVNIIIQALDSQSFAEYVRKPANSNAVGESLADHLERHDGRAANAIRFLNG